MSWQGAVLFSAVYVAVRDHNWATVPPIVKIRQSDDDGTNFRLRVEAEHREGPVHFRWQGFIALRAEGTFDYEMKGEALSDFQRNRIGFCVLHPLEMAGSPVRVCTPEGMRSGSFPELISPQDPFVAMNGLEIAWRDMFKISMAFEGELFQTEDQRNWTDGSYKTFCTPLDLPYPVQVRAGDNVEQKIRVRVVSLSAPDRPVGRNRISVGARTGHRLPRIGTTWSPECSSLSPKQAELHRRAAWSDLRAVIALDEEDWRGKLKQASYAAAEMNTRLHVELIVPYRMPNLNDLALALLACGSLLSSLSIYPSRLEGAPSSVKTVCPLNGASFRATQYVTSEAHLLMLKGLLSAHAIEAAAGGGSRGNFAEWNRAELPFGLMDFTEFAVNPQVHATDVRSIMETLPAQATAVHTARARVPELPVNVSSVALKPAFNPYAANDEAVLASADRKGRYDVRLQANAIAAWTLGSISSLSAAGASAIRYFEHAGSLGMMDEQGEAYPVFRVLTELADMREADLLPAVSASKSFSALVLRKGDRLRLLVGELAGVPSDVTIDCSELGVPCRDATVRTPGNDGASGTRLPEGSVWNLKLSPYAILAIDADLTT